MKQEAIDRLKRIRELYLQGPVFVDRIGYTRTRRQRLNYMKALEGNGHLYSYRLRKSHADAYLLDHMEPVINDDELLVGLPDVTPLTEEEAAEYKRLEEGMKFAPRSSPITAEHMALD